MHLIVALVSDAFKAANAVSSSVQPLNGSDWGKGLCRKLSLWWNSEFKVLRGAIFMPEAENLDKLWEESL